MRLRVDVSKNFSTAESSQDGEFDTPRTAEDPFSTSASPSPVIVLTPVLGDAATASCPCSRSLLTSLDPIRPVPPITTIFMTNSFHSRPRHFEPPVSFDSWRRKCLLAFEHRQAENLFNGHEHWCIFVFHQEDDEL